MKDTIDFWKQYIEDMTNSLELHKTNDLSEEAIIKGLELIDVTSNIKGVVPSVFCGYPPFPKEETTEKLGIPKKLLEG